MALKKISKTRTGYTATATNRATGQKTTRSGVLSSVSKNEFEPKMLRKATSIAKANARKNKLALDEKRSKGGRIR